METPLSPEIESMIRRHLAHGCSSTPESVIKQALGALDEREAHDVKREETAMHDEDAHPQLAPQASPLLQWLRDTSDPAKNLETLRRRLAGIPGSLSDALDAERQDRL